MISTDDAGYIRDRLASAEVQSEPFPHIYTESILRPCTYQAMLESLPSHDYVMSCEQNTFTDTSRIFDLFNSDGSGKGLEKTAALWRERFSPILESLSDAIVERWQVHLARYYEELLKASHITVAPAKVKRGQSLFCFRPAGWRILPHTHGLTQLLQTMVYFPSEGFRTEQGTYFYELPWYRPTKIYQDKATRYRFPGRATLMPFAHNALVSWINTPRAVHGTVDHPGDSPRRYIFMAHVTDRPLLSTHSNRVA
jgi:hypothetical protein